MTKEMTRWGVGPVYAIVSIILGAVILLVSHYWLPAMTLAYDTLIFTSGLTLIAAGIAIFLIAAFQVHTGFNKGELVTGGVYAYVRHPVYAVWILLIVPGLALATGYLLLLLLPFMMYFLYKALIGEEETDMERSFGDAYLSYRGRVNPIVPKFRVRK